MAILIKKSSRPHKWVRLTKYCDITGDTKHGVHARRQKGIWVDGKHTILGPDKKIWVNLEETEKWVEFGNKVKQ